MYFTAVIQDETWIHHYNSESEQQSMQRKERMIAQSLLAEKCLLCRNGYSTASHTIATICNTRSDKKVAVGGVESPLYRKSPTNAL